MVAVGTGHKLVDSESCKRLDRKREFDEAHLVGYNVQP